MFKKLSYLIITIALFLFLFPGCAPKKPVPSEKPLPPSGTNTAVQDKTSDTPEKEINPDRAESLVSNGMKALDNKEYDKAMKLFEQALKENPKHSMAHAGIGRVLSEKKEYKKAFTEFDKALDLAPDQSISWVNRGNAYAHLKDYDKAIKDYEKAIAVNPKDYRGYFNRGKAVLRSTMNLSKKDYEKALTDFNKAVSLEVDSDEPFVERGNVYRHMGELDKSETDLKKALEIRKSAAAHCELAHTYMEMDKNDEALKHLNEAIRIDPEFNKDPYFSDPTNFINGYFSRGMVYADSGQPEKALEDYDRAVKLRPDDPKILIERAYVKSILKDEAGAKKDAEEWLNRDKRAKNPKNDEDYLNLGNAFLFKGDYDKAIENYNRSADMGNEFIVFLDRGRAYAKKGDREKAMKDFKEAAKRASRQQDKDLVNRYMNELKQ